MVTCTASDPNDDEITYSWRASAGTITGEGNTINYIAPDEEANIFIVCKVTDIDQAFDTDSLQVLIRDPDQGQTGDLVAHYEFNGNANDITGNGNDGSVTNCIYTEDMHGVDNQTIYFNQSSSKVIVSNTSDLNFKDGLTVSFWLNINQFYDHESYPISHGNWMTRWKTSLTEERLRFTINGSEGIIDLDSETKLNKDVWYHIVALYNGKDCLVYLDGELDGFNPFAGQINTTSYDLVFGQSLPDQSGFNYNGKLDKVRIYNYGISHEEVKKIYTEEISSIFDRPLSINDLNIFPNPSDGELNIEAKTNSYRTVEITVTSLPGQILLRQKTMADNRGIVREKLNLENLSPGSYFITLQDNNSMVTRLFIHR